MAAARPEGAGRVGATARTGRETIGAGRESGAGARKSDRAGIAMGRRLTNSGSVARRVAGREIIGTGARKSGRTGTASGRRFANPVSTGTRGVAVAGVGVASAGFPMRPADPRAKSWGANRADGNGRRLAKRPIGRAGEGTDRSSLRELGGTGGWSGFSHGRGEPDATGLWSWWW